MSTYINIIITVMSPLWAHYNGRAEYELPLNSATACQLNRTTTDVTRIQLVSPAVDALLVFVRSPDNTTGYNLVSVTNNILPYLMYSNRFSDE